MIFNKNVIAAVALLLSVSLQAHAHAAISPALGIKGQPKRSDVQRPSDAKPCGNVNIAQNLDSSQAIQLKPDNTFSATIQNFNAGVDGSLQVDKVVVDASGTGQKFVAAQMVTNGVRNPSKVTSAAISVKLPSGTKCQGGKNKDRCVVSLKTAGGFGNCVVVQQAKASAATGATKATVNSAKKTATKAKANASIATASKASTASAAASSSVAASATGVATASVSATSVVVSSASAASSSVDASVVDCPDAVTSTVTITITPEASLTTVSVASATQNQVASDIAAAPSGTSTKVAKGSTGSSARSARVVRRAELKNRMVAA